MADNDDFNAAAIDDLFSYIGRYVIAFQTVEAEVDQSLLFLWGHDDWTTSQHRLSRMRNQEKVNALRAEVRKREIFYVEYIAKDWAASFFDLIERLHNEREYRNSLLHSQYICDFLPIASPIIQSDRKKSKNGAEFRRLELTKELQDEAIMRAILLGMEAGQMRRQLIRTAYLMRQKSSI